VRVHDYFPPTGRSPFRPDFETLGKLKQLTLLCHLFRYRGISAKELLPLQSEPFMPHHVVESVKDQLAGKTKLSVPMHEIMV